MPIKDTKKKNYMYFPSIKEFNSRVLNKGYTDE